MLIFDTCVLVNTNLCGKLISSLELPTTYDEIYFGIPHLNLLSCELNNFPFQAHIMLKQNEITMLLQLFAKNLK